MIARFLSALAMVVVLLGVIPESRAADTIEVTRVELMQSATDTALLLTADFYLPLTSRIREVLLLGVPLHFVVEFVLTKPRWYWRKAEIISVNQHYRVSYHPITRRFRITQFGYPQEFLTLEQAVASMTRMRGWTVGDTKDLEPDDVYTGALRMRLDSTRLPGPLQVDMITNQDWNLKAPWKRFSVTLATVTNAP